MNTRLVAEKGENTMAMCDIRIERSTRFDIQNPNAFEVKDIKVILNGVLMNPSAINYTYIPHDRAFDINMRFSTDEFMRKMRANKTHNMIHNKAHESSDRMTIRKVIFNDPATIVFWEDGTKTVVKCHNEQYDPEKGLAMAISKKACGNRGSYYGVFKKYLNEYKAQKLPEFDFGKQMTFSDALNNLKEAIFSTFANNKNEEVFLE